MDEWTFRYRIIMKKMIIDILNKLLLRKKINQEEYKNLNKILNNNEKLAWEMVKKLYFETL
jgi:hypothetical protein